MGDLAHSSGQGAASIPSPAEILDRAADLLTPEGTWTQGTWARTADGSSDATPGADVCWCGYGAIRRATDFNSDATDVALECVRRVIDEHLIEWNDKPGRTQAEVVEALRAAADRARSEAGQ